MSKCLQPPVLKKPVSETSATVKRKTVAPQSGKEMDQTGYSGQMNIRPRKSTLTCYHWWHGALRSTVPREARGDKPSGTHPTPGVSMLLADQDEDKKPQEKPQEEASAGPDSVEEAVSKVMAQMFRISPDEPTKDTTLGPTPTSEILLDGMLTTALVDTGSPVSIVSLAFFLEAAAAKREKGQTPAAWGKAVRQRLRPATMSLHCYGGTQLAIVGQALCRRLSTKWTHCSESPRRPAVGNRHPSPAWLHLESGRARRPTSDAARI